MLLWSLADIGIDMADSDSDSDSGVGVCGVVYLSERCA